MTFIPSQTSANNVQITGGTINGTVIGGTTPAAATVSSLTNTGSEVGAIRVITSGSTVTQTATDHKIIVNKSTGSSTTVTLLASPTVGMEVVIIDGKGDAATNPITIAGNGKTINALTSVGINVNNGVAELTYTGTQWVVTAVVGTLSLQPVVATIPATESAAGSRVSNTSQAIYSGSTTGVAPAITGPFVQWGLNSSAQVVRAGSADTTTSNAVLLYYDNSHTVWQENSSNSWYYWNTSAPATSPNLIPNSSNQGAVVNSTTLPTGWTSSPNGTTYQVVGVGTDNSQGFALPYVDIHITGTTGSVNGDISFSPAANVSVSSANTYTYSYYLAVTAGDRTPFASWVVIWNELVNGSYNSSPGVNASPNQWNPNLPGSSLIQSSLTGQPIQANSANGVTASNGLSPNVLIQTNANTTVDITIRIAGVQVTQSSSVQSFSSTPAYTSAWTPSTNPVPSSPTIYIQPMPTVPVNSYFTVTGTLAGYSSAPSMNYRDNSGTYQPFPSGASITQYTWSFTHPPMTAQTMTIQVQDSATSLTSSASNSFTVAAPSNVTVTGISLSSTTFTAGAPVGTVIGNITIATSGGSFPSTGTLTLGGTNASLFSLTGSVSTGFKLVAATTNTPIASYNITLTATY